MRTALSAPGGRGNLTQRRQVGGGGLLEGGTPDPTLPSPRLGCGFSLQDALCRLLQQQSPPRGYPWGERGANAEGEGGGPRVPLTSSLFTTQFSASLQAAAQLPLPSSAGYLPDAGPACPPPPLGHPAAEEEKGNEPTPPAWLGGANQGVGRAAPGRLKALGGGVTRRLPRTPCRKAGPESPGSALWCGFASPSHQPRCCPHPSRTGHFRGHSLISLSPPGCRGWLCVDGSPPTCRTRLVSAWLRWSPYPGAPLGRGAPSPEWQGWC